MLCCVALCVVVVVAAVRAETEKSPSAGMVLDCPFLNLKKRGGWVDRELMW